MEIHIPVRRKLPYSRGLISHLIARRITSFDLTESFRARPMETAR